MKRFFILSVIAAIFGLTSCTGEGDGIVGTWEATRMSMNIEGLPMEVPLKEAGLEMELTFRSNGTGTWDQIANGEENGFDFNYTLNGTRLTISAEGESLSFPITLEGDNMSLQFAEDMIDTEYPATLHFVRK